MVSKILLGFVFCLVGLALFSGFSYAFTGCQTIVDANLGQTLTLEDNITGWSGSCFSLNFADPNAGDNNYLEIACDDFSIDSNAVSSIFFDQNNFDINRVYFWGCDINMSATDNIFLDIDADINYIDILNSPIVLTSGEFFTSNSVVNSEINLNFSGFTETLSGSGDGFYLTNSEYDNFIVRNLDLTLSSSGLSLFRVFNTADINSLSIYDSNITISNNVSFFDYANSISDTFLSFNFNNTDANYLLFNDLNLSLTAMGAGEYFISDTNNSDLNYIAFTGTNIIDLNSTNLFSADFTADSYLNFDFTNSTIDVEDGVMVFFFTDSNISTFEASDLNVSASPNYYYYNVSNSDLNSVLLLDSNVFVSGDAYFVNLVSTTDSEIDWNFSGTVIDINVNVAGAGFYFSSSNYDSFSIYDLIGLTYTDSGSALFKVLGSSDVNTFTFLNSVFDISSNSTFYDAATTTQDTFLSFDFNNTDSNYLLFKDLNLNLTSFDSSDSFIKIDNNSDLNYIVFESNAVNIDVNDGLLITFTGNTNYDSFTFQFNNNLINLSDNAFFLRLADGNYNSITFEDANIVTTAGTGYSIILLDSNISSVLFLNSTVNVTTADFVRELTNSTYTSQDWNFSGSDINLSTGSNLFDVTSAIFSSDFNISELVVTSLAEPVFRFGADVNVESFNITDSNFYLDQFITMVENSSHVFGGTIYNNIFKDIDLDTIFVFDNSEFFLADFNTALNENNQSKRAIWLNDDSNATGGNLWLNGSGTNQCTTDSVEPYGICDHNNSIILSVGYLYDYLPLVAYSAPVDDDSPGGGGGGGSSSSYEFVAESSASDKNYYVGTKIKVTLKEADSIAIIPNVDVNLTYPDGNVETFKTNASGYFEFTPEQDGNYSFKYKTNKDKTTITVYSASLAPKETVVKEEPVVTPKTEPVKETVKETTTDQNIAEDTNKETIEDQEEQEPFNWWNVWIPGIIVIIVLAILVFVVFKPKAPGQMF